MDTFIQVVQILGLVAVGVILLMIIAFGCAVTWIIIAVNRSPSCRPAEIKLIPRVTISEPVTPTTTTTSDFKGQTPEVQAFLDSLRFENPDQSSIKRLMAIFSRPRIGVSPPWDTDWSNYDNN